MKISIRNTILYLFFGLFLGLAPGFAQLDPDPLFTTGVEPKTPEDLMTLRLQVQIKALRKETNDSTYMPSTLYYKNLTEWDSVPVKLRTRGEFRLKKCVFPPVKLKFSRKDIESTVFSGQKKLKLVVPCQLEEAKNDNVVKEYMAFKLYEPISPYHFETRLVNLEWVQKAKKKSSGFQLKGILLEDMDHLAKRFNGNEFDRQIHPMRLDTLNAIRHAFFQYMIGNNDYSVVLGHNRKALYIDNQFLIIPYDFDLSGLVNADYGKSSDVQNLRFMGDQPAERVYRDFPRDPELMQEVRQEYLDHKKEIVEVMTKLEPFFDDSDEYAMAEAYVLYFFKVLEDDKKFDRNLVRMVKQN